MVLAFVRTPLAKDMVFALLTEIEGVVEVADVVEETIGAPPAIHVVVVAACSYDKLFRFMLLTSSRFSGLTGPC